MCLIFVALDHHPKYSLVVAANRDEFFNRPAKKLHHWDNTDLLAGKDLSAGGSWLGATESGRFAALTNFRDPANSVENPVTRGSLVSDYLLNGESPETYLASIEPNHAQYEGFNLLVSDQENFWYYSNRHTQPAQRLSKGIYGLSNHLLDTPWPKVKKGKQAFESALKENPLNKDSLINDLLDVMNDRTMADDSELPNTGIDLHMERFLSSRFIHTDSEIYGTRCSTILLVDREGEITMTEKTWDKFGNASGEDSVVTINTSLSV